MHHKKAKHHMEKALHALSKMAEAGHKENKSMKHRKAESKGMKKAMKKKHHEE